MNLSLRNIYEELTNENFLNKYPIDYKYSYYFFLMVMNMGGLVWGILALYFNFPFISLIPFGYILFSFSNLFFLYYTQNFQIVRFLQVLNSILLPFLFQWLLGGFVPSGAVMLWSFLALLALLTFYHVKEVWLWLVFFIVLMLFTVYTDDISYENAPVVLLDQSVQRILFTINITMIGVMVFLLARYFIASNREKKRLNLILRSQQEELIAQNKKINEKNEEITQFGEEMKQQNEEMLSINEELEKQKRLLESKNSAVLSSINYAQRIQKALMGSTENLSNYFSDSFIFYQPRDVVSGDFFWFHEVRKQGARVRRAFAAGSRDLLGEPEFSENEFENDSLKIIVVADCTGHGVPGAFMTVLGLNFLEEIIYNRHMTNPADILTELDKKWIRTLQRESSDNQINDGMDMAILTIDEKNHKLYFAGAKNPMFLVRNGELQTLKASVYPIGSNQYKEDKKFQNLELEYHTGDICYLFSDGFQDQFGGQEDKKYMKKRFREFLLQNSDLPMINQHKRIQDEFEHWKGRKAQTDDLIVLGLKLI